MRSKDGIMGQQAESIQTGEPERGQRVDCHLLLLEEVKQLERLRILELRLYSVDPEDVESFRKSSSVCFNFGFDTCIDGNPASKSGGVLGEVLRKLRQCSQGLGRFRNELNSTIRQCYTKSIGVRS